MEEIHCFTLSNGIRVVHYPMKREIGHCGLLIGAGSRDELNDEHGIAHFLEHCLFKGTKRRKTFHILSRLDAVGGELNAFTAKEETWIHASFLKEHFERAIELIADIAFESTFPEKELEREKEVILDEINSYQDSPGEMIFEEFDTQFFGSHPLGRSILGTAGSLREFGCRHLVGFRDRIFSKENLVFSCAGPIDLKRLTQLLESHLGKYPLKSQPIVREPYRDYKASRTELKKDIHQVHYLMGFPAFDYPDERRPALSLLNNVLGGPGLNNRLSLNIREKHGFAYHIDSSYAPFTDAGIFSVYLGTDKNHLSRSEKLIWKELNALRDKKLSTRQLHEAKRQLYGQIALAQDSGGALMFNLGKSYLLFDRVDTTEEVFRKIDQITSEQVIEAANEVLDRNKMTELVYTY